MRTSALVLHLWQTVAEGGNEAPSPVTLTSSTRGSITVIDADAVTSVFF